LSGITRLFQEREDVMERRDFLKVALSVAAGAAAFAASVQAAPLMPQPLADDGRLPANPDAQPAVTDQNEVENLQPEEVRWYRHYGWRRRYWRRRYWRRRYWRHRYWRRRYWRRRYWRRRYWY
jgi:hypothetical protein